MWQFKVIKGGIIGLVVLLGLLLGGLEVLSRIYEKKAAAFFREKFTQQSDLLLQPFETSVSVWPHFPRITFKLKNLALVDTSGSRPITVLEIKKAEIAVPLSQYNLEEVQISQVDLTDVLFYQKVDSAGNKFGLRFKQLENPDTASSKLHFIIPELNIENARIHTENFYKQSGFSIMVRNARLKASLANQELKIKGTLEGEVGSVTSKKLILFQNEPFTGTADYAYNLKQKKGILNNTSLNLNEHQIQITGGHTQLPQRAGMDLDFKISGNQPLLYLLTQLLPVQAKTFLSEIQTTSKMQYALHITGKSSPTVRPRNLIRFKLDKGEIYLPTTKTIIKQVNLVGEMDNGELQKQETTRLTISDFSAHTREDSFQVNLEVYNFKNPVFKFSGDGRIRLANLASFVKLPASRIAGGDVVGKVQLSGTLPDSAIFETPDWKGNGSVKIQRATFRPVGLNVDCRNVNGRVQFHNSLLELQNLKGTIAGSPFKVQASIQNYLAYLFDQPGAIKAKATIYSATMNTDWIAKGVPGRRIRTKAKNQKSNAKKTEDSYRQATLAGIGSEVNLRVDNVHLPVGKKLTNLAVLVNQRNENIKLTHMRFVSAGGGVATADGGFKLTEQGFNDQYLNVHLNYPTLDFQSFLQNLTAIKATKKPASEKATKNAIKNAKKTAVGKHKKTRSGFLKKEDYRLNLTVEAAKIRYLHLTGTNLKLRASMNSQEVKIAKLDFASCGGEIHMRGNMQLDAPDQTYPVRLKTELHNLNLQQVFTIAEKMNLDVLKGENIRGTIECNLTLLTNLDKAFIPRLEKTTAYARATFLDLELIEVAPIQNALKLLKKDRTRHLYFEDLTTNFILNNKQFLTPGLRMNSNLTSFNLTGYYTMGGGTLLNMDVGVMNILVGNNKRRIKRIQEGDSTLSPNFKNKQHLVITRDQQKYKVNLSNRKQREERAAAIKQQYRQLIQRYQIDTVYTMRK